MMKFILVACGVLIVVCMTVFFLWRLALKKMDSQEETIRRLANRLREVEDRKYFLEQTVEVLKKNREAANERIESLHKGDAADNALVELSKHKN